MANLPAMLVITNLLLLFCQISSTTDKITQFESLPDGNTLVSKDGIFEMGFFNPGNSSNRYVGIWYKNISVRRVVWVANRDNPTKDNSSKLIISQEGNLVLLNQNQSILWSTTTTTTTTKRTSSPLAQLMDNGNLVLREEKENNNNEESFLWQSFDHLSDTLLQGMKLGLNKRTGLNRLLTSWKNWDDPSSGYMTSGMILTNNPEDVIWKGATVFYRSGPMIGAQSNGLFGLRSNPLFDYNFVNNEDEVYYTFSLKNSSLISILVLNQTLSVRQRLVWDPESRTWNTYQSLPQDSCDVYDVCGANGRCVIDGSPMCQCLDGFKPKSPEQWNAMDWSQGCVRGGNWSCGVKKRDGFRKFVGMKLPDTTNSWIDENMKLEDCKAKCLENCSCTAYSNFDTNGAGSPLPHV